MIMFSSVYGGVSWREIEQKFREVLMHLDFDLQDRVKTALQQFILTMTTVSTTSGH